MKQYVYAILIASIITGSITYALSQETLEEKLERENKEILSEYAKEQRDCYANATGTSNQIFRKYDSCGDRPKPKLKTLSSDGSTGSGEIKAPGSGNYNSEPYITIYFKNGCPVKVDGKPHDGMEWSFTENDFEDYEGCENPFGTSTPDNKVDEAKLEECLSKYTKIDNTIANVCMDYAKGTRTSNLDFEIVTERLSQLHEKVCQKQINSPLCKDEALFDRLYQLTEERLPGKNFYPILLGITNAESSLGLNFAKDKVGGTCAGRNNWGGIKWKKTDDGKSVKDQQIPDQFGCYLYKFDSIEDYWISKVNTIRFGYPGCVDSKTPVRCLSGKYVGDPNVQEQSWINNVSIFL